MNDDGTVLGWTVKSKEIHRYLIHNTHILHAAWCEYFWVLWVLGFSKHLGTH